MDKQQLYTFINNKVSLEALKMIHSTPENLRKKKQEHLQNLGLYFTDSGDSVKVRNVDKLQ